jgi:Domain of unknown function (DUF4861)
VVVDTLVELKSDEFVCGLVKRKDAGISRNEEECWIGLWGPTNDDTVNGSLGTAVVMSPSPYKAMAEDNDQYLIIGKARSGQTVTYYAGAGWTRSGDFASVEDWNRYLVSVARKIRSPLTVTMTVNE